MKVSRSAWKPATTPHKAEATQSIVMSSGHDQSS
jgi:hypothetical protein